MEAGGYAVPINESGTSTVSETVGHSDVEVRYVVP